MVKPQIQVLKGRRSGTQVPAIRSRTIPAAQFRIRRVATTPLSIAGHPKFRDHSYTVGFITGPNSFTQGIISGRIEVGQFSR